MHACRRDRIGGLDVPVTVVDTGSCCIFSCDTLHYINVVIGSEILSLSPEPETIIYHFGELRVVRELFVRCRKNGKKTFLTNNVLITSHLLCDIYKDNS